MDKSLIHRIDQNNKIDDVLNLVDEIFDSILNHEMWINDFFIHPLGFYYCRLYFSDEHQIRLHIWEPNYNIKKDLYIHDHFYDLCSWVLCGKIHDYTYDIKQTTEKSDYCMFTSSYKIDKNVRVLEKTENYLLVKIINERIIQTNEKYLITKDTFHSNKILFEESDLTATFVYTFNHKDNHTPNVVGFIMNEIYDENDPVRISPKKVKELILKTKTNIERKK